MKKRIISIIAVLCMVITALPMTTMAATGLTLTKTPVANTGATIAVSGGSGTVVATSSNTAVATVSVSGTTVTVSGVSGAEGTVTVTVTRGSYTADIQVPIGYTTFSFSGRVLTVYAGSSGNYEIVAIAQSSETEYTGAEGTGELTVGSDASGNVTYTVASGYELVVGLKKKGGTYCANGVTSSSNFVVKKEATKDSTLLLDGLSITSQFTSVVTVNKDSTAAFYINALGGTVNTFTDNAVNNADTYGATADGGDGTNQYFAESAVIKCKTASNVTISGSGTLNINANAKNGIKSGASSFLTITGSVILNVQSVDNGISSENEMTIAGGTIGVTSTGDAIKAADDTDLIGVIYVTGGETTVNSGDEGLLARASVYISGGILNITCVGDGIKAEDVNETAGDVLVTGGEITIHSTGDGIAAASTTAITGGTINITCANGYTNTSYNGSSTTTPSAKCIKARVENTISGGTFTLSTPDDAIHCDGNLTIKGGTFTINTRDDAFHADYTTTMGIRGASNELINVYVGTCYEGIEGAEVVCNSGTYEIHGTDDVINAANSDLANYAYTINIFGGFYRLYTSAGDGLDSNGKLIIHNGDLEVFSQPNADNSPLDSETGISLLNGITLGVGSSQMAETPSAGVYVEFRNLSISNGKTIVIKDSSGTILKSTTAYWSVSSSANYMVFSHPALVSGNTYYLYVNGSQVATGTASGAAVDDTPWTDIASTATNVYERVTSMGTGSSYIITNASLTSPVYTLKGGTSVSSQSSTLTAVTGGYTFGTVNESNTWHMDATGHIYCTVSDVNYYLYYTSSSSGWSTTYTLGITSASASATAWSVAASGSGVTITTSATGGGGGQPGGGGMATTLYLYCSSGTWKLSSSSGGSSSYVCYLYAPAVEQAALTGTLYYVAENDEGFTMSNIQSETNILYRDSRSGSTQTLAWSNSHITTAWEPAFVNTVNGEYVLTVYYDSIAIGTVTVVIVGDQQALTVTFTGDYVATVEVPYGSTVTMPTAPDGYNYLFYLNGVEFDPATPITANITINVVLEQIVIPPTVLYGDVNNDGVVNFSDVTILYASINGAISSTINYDAADFNRDGSISFSDVSALYSALASI